MPEPARRIWIGKSVRRKEDPRLISGRGLYTDNIQVKGTLYTTIFRSPVAHAKIRKIDVSKAKALAGVVSVITGPEAKEMWSQPFRAIFTDLKLTEYPLTWDKVRYVGEPVAAVLATEKGIAEDALDLIEFEYEPLQAVVDPEEALRQNSPLVFDELGSNVFVHKEFNYGDVDSAFREADYTVKGKFKLHRYSSTPLEPDVIIASYDKSTAVLTMQSNMQGQRWSAPVCRVLGIPLTKFRNIHGDAGGAFGERVTGTLSAACIAGLFSIKAERPVKYIADRKEMMIHGGSKRGVYEAELAVMKDGRVRALRMKDITEEGASCTWAGYYNTIKLTNITGLYRIESVRMDAYNLATNLSPGAANRGLSKPHMAFVLERLMDMAAEKLGVDPAEFRFRNMLRPNELPYITPSGNYLDNGNYPLLLETALKKVGYEQWREEQKRARSEGRYIGIGIACGVDPGAANPGREFLLKPSASRNVGATTAASVRIYPSGSVEVSIAAVNEGQSHETAVAQVVADELGISYDDVNVIPVFDSFSGPWTPHSGTGADHFVMTDMGAVVGATRKIKQKMAQIAAHRLEARPEDIELKSGRAYVKGSEDFSLSVKEIVSIAYHETMLLPDGMEPGLHENFYYMPHKFATTYPSDESGRATAHMSYGSQAHIAVVDVNTETGKVKVLKYVATHDSGVMINPMIVTGQFQGHGIHGVSVTLGEGYVYDEDGQILTGTFMDYLKPTALEAVDFDVEHFEFPAIHTIIGAKPVGEGPFNCPMAAITNAVVDALKPFGIQFTELPLSPERIWKETHRSIG